MKTIHLEKLKIIARSIHSYLFPFVDKREKAKFIESQAGKPMLLDRNGQGFISENKYGNKTYWQCRKYKKQRKRNQETCPARAITDGIYVKSWRFEHNHPFEDFEDKNVFEDSTGFVESSKDTTPDPIEIKGIGLLQCCCFYFLGVPGIYVWKRLKYLQKVFTQTYFFL